MNEENETENDGERERLINEIKKAQADLQQYTDELLEDVEDAVDVAEEEETSIEDLREISSRLREVADSQEQGVLLRKKKQA